MLVIQQKDIFQGKSLQIRKFCNFFIVSLGDKYNL